MHRLSFFNRMTVDGALVSEDSFEVTASGLIQVEESVANASTDLEIVVAIDQSAMVGLYLVSDQDVLVETNSGSAADDSFALKANVPVAWASGESVGSNPITADVTSIFVTNASGSAATLKLIALYDATP